MTLALHHVTVDCADALALATFWGAALDKPVDGGDAAFASIGGGASDGQGWLFFQVPEGKSAKNRMHVDLRSDDRAADVERLVGLGATIDAERDQWGTRWTVLRDPEGNEFCIVQLAAAEPDGDDSDGGGRGEDGGATADGDAGDGDAVEGAATT